MANTVIAYGSAGEEVKKLQTALNTKGYHLTVDGQYGEQTRDAVTDYQKKNSLTADGTVGDATWNSLLGSTAQKNQVAAPLSEPLSNGFTPSAQVEEARRQYENLAGEPASVYESQYEAQLSELMDKITSREKFSYDLSEDPMYGMLRRSYEAAGKNAMEDAMGQTAALTGGYGSTYSQTAGLAQYNAYLDRLWGQVPGLMENAYSRYKNETDDLYRQYQALAEAEKENRDAYLTEEELHRKETESAYKKYRDLWEDEYEAFENDRAYGLKLADMEMENYWKSVAASQKASASTGSSSGSKSGGSSSAKTSKSTNSSASGLTYDSVRAALEKKGTFQKANLLTERGYNLLRERDDKEGTVSPASQSATYQRYLQEMLKKYG